MDCFGCKWHETFSDEIGGEWFNDGCVCNHEQAEEDRHTKCCWDYNGKEKCPYREEDDDDDE